MSTASNYLFSPATNLVNDVFVRYMAPDASNKRVLIVSRLAVVLLGCWALYQAVYAESILQKMLWAYTIYSAALTPVVLAAFYSKRVTAWGAVAAIAERHSGHAGVGFARSQSPLPAHHFRSRRHLSCTLYSRRRAHHRKPFHCASQGIPTRSIRRIANLPRQSRDAKQPHQWPRLLIGRSDANAPLLGRDFYPRP